MSLNTSDQPSKVVFLQLAAHKRGEEESAGESERESSQDSSETCCRVWFGDSGTNRKTGGRAGGSRTEDVKVSGSDQRWHTVSTMSTGRLFEQNVTVVRSRWFAHVQIMDILGKRC